MAALHALVLAAISYRALTWRTFRGVVLDSTRGNAVLTMMLLQRGAGAPLVTLVTLVQLTAGFTGRQGHLNRCRVTA